VSVKGADASLSASDVIALLDLAPHPEGGHYAETIRDGSVDGVRAHSSAIYFLLSEGEVSQWHRVDAVEVWHWYAGAPLEISIARDGEKALSAQLGAALQSGQRPQFMVPSGVWQSARSLGAWSLMGCTVAPAFEFAGFEMAPAGWEPGGD
jgi:hypothetical protein